MHQTSVDIRLNGQRRGVPVGSTVTMLLADLGFAGQPVVVEVNGAAVFPRDFSATVFNHGDAVEVVRIVAGG